MEPTRTRQLQTLIDSIDRTTTGTMKLRCRSADLATEWRAALLVWGAYAQAYKQGTLQTHPATAEAQPSTTTTATSSSRNNNTHVSSTASVSSVVSSLGAKTAATAAAATSMISGGGNSAASHHPTAVVVRGGAGKRPVIMPKVLSGRLQVQSGLLGQLSEKTFAVKPTDGTLKHYNVRREN